MLLYMIKSSGGNYLKAYQQTDTNTFSALWTGTASNGKVYFSWSEVAEVAAKVGGTILKFKLES